MPSAEAPESATATKRLATFDSAVSQGNQLRDLKKLMTNTTTAESVMVEPNAVVAFTPLSTSIFSSLRTFVEALAHYHALLLQIRFCEAQRRAALELNVILPIGKFRRIEHRADEIELHCPATDFDPDFLPNAKSVDCHRPSP